MGDCISSSPPAYPTCLSPCLSPLLIPHLAYPPCPEGGGASERGRLDLLSLFVELLPKVDPLAPDAVPANTRACMYRHTAAPATTHVCMHAHRNASRRKYSLHSCSTPCYPLPSHLSQAQKPAAPLLPFPSWLPSPTRCDEDIIYTRRDIHLRPIHHSVL